MNFTYSSAFLILTVFCLVQTDVLGGLFSKNKPQQPTAIPVYPGTYPGAYPGVYPAYNAGGLGRPAYGPGSVGYAPNAYEPAYPSATYEPLYHEHNHFGPARHGYPAGYRTGGGASSASAAAGRGGASASASSA